MLGKEISVKSPVWSEFNIIRESDFTSIVDEASDNEVNIMVEGCSIVIKGLNEDVQVMIFRADGTLVFETKSEGGFIYYQPDVHGIYI